MVVVRLPKEFLGLNVGVFQLLVLFGLVLIGGYLYLRKKGIGENRKWYHSKEIYSTLIIYTSLMVIGMFGTAWLNNAEWNQLTRSIEQEKEEFLVETEGILLRNVTDRDIIEYMGELYETEADMVRLKKRKKESVQPIAEVFTKGSKLDLGNMYDTYSEEDRENILRADYESLSVFTDVELAIKDSNINRNVYRLSDREYKNVRSEQKRLQSNLEEVRSKEIQEEDFLGAVKGVDVFKRAVWLSAGSLVLSYLFTLVVKFIVLGDEDLEIRKDVGNQEKMEEYLFGEYERNGVEDESKEGDGFYEDDGVIVFDENHKEDKQEEKDVEDE